MNVRYIYTQTSYRHARQYEVYHPLTVARFSRQLLESSQLYSTFKKPYKTAKLKLCLDILKNEMKNICSCYRLYIYIFPIYPPSPPPPPFLKLELSYSNNISFRNQPHSSISRKCYTACIITNYIHHTT